MSRLFSLLVACALLVAVASPSDASMTLTLSDGTNSVTIVDADNDGVVAYNGSLGGTSSWSINVTAGFSKPALGNLSFADMDLLSGNVSSAGGGSLTISLSDDNFIGASPAIAQAFNFSVGGTTSGVVSGSAYASDTNSLFALTENVGNLGPFTGAFSGATQTPTTQTGGANYSATIIMDIVHSVASQRQISSFDARLQAVPEPASIAAWSLLAMMGVGGLVWSRRR